ncbi:YdcH family protein [Arenibaculum pallidiluteum]|uniref:YdcH family protein n=1 Tax=Arenibaculum pallidiluteum TaxID=2812559 RepID=UPI001A966AD9|nr:YdcH family protein [Arenibaculum pallidiluteum]
MPVETRLASLRDKHAALDRIIREEEQRPWPNDQEIKRLKLEKLYVKEQIDGLSVRPHIAAE